MNVKKVYIPKETKFISDLEGYKIPDGKCIVDKKVCGCGYTQFCLNNREDVILCSPRLALLQNKSEQNPHCHYFSAIKLNKREINSLGLITDDDITQYIYKLQTDLVNNYLFNRRASFSPIKFLVTYDSLPKLVSILTSLGEDINRYKIVVDEFQLIFTDARFKATIEMDFVTYLNTYCKNVTYLSSTPMLNNYLDQLPEFKDLDYYEFVWDNSRISLPKISHIKTDNLEKSALEIIDMYLSGDGPTKEVDGVVYKATSAVLYVNNVSMLTSIIKNSKMTPDQVNIITAQTLENKRKIRKCGKGFGFGHIPILGEPCKPITLCTSTAFCGVDMYNSYAKSYVFSDCNLKTMAIDISLELPQIVGRQRLSSNVFRYDVTMYYLEDLSSKTREEFEQEIETKNRNTFNKISNFDFLDKGGQDIDGQRELLRRDAIHNQYFDDYCSINKLDGRPILNKLVRLSDIRAWELQHYIYANDYTVLRVLETVGEVTSNEKTSDAVEKMMSESYFEDRLKYLCGYISENPNEINNLPEKYKYFFENLPISEIEASGYRKRDLTNKIEKLKTRTDSFSDDRLISEIFKTFKVGESYSNKIAKSTLKRIFSGRNICVKATDLNKYFEISRVKIKNPETGKYEDGFKLIKKLGDNS